MAESYTVTSTQNKMSSWHSYFTILACSFPCMTSSDYGKNDLKAVNVVYPLNLFAVSLFLCLFFTSVALLTTIKLLLITSFKLFLKACIFEIFCNKSILHCNRVPPICSRFTQAYLIPPEASIYQHFAI